MSKDAAVDEPVATLDELRKATDPTWRGYEFERLLHEMLKREGLDPRKSFRSQANKLTARSFSALQRSYTRRNGSSRPFQHLRFTSSKENWMANSQVRWASLYP